MIVKNVTGSSSVWSWLKLFEWFLNTQVRETQAGPEKHRRWIEDDKTCCGHCEPDRHSAGGLLLDDVQGKFPQSWTPFCALCSSKDPCPCHARYKEAGWGFYCGNNQVKFDALWFLRLYLRDVPHSSICRPEKLQSICGSWSVLAYCQTIGKGNFLIWDLSGPPIKCSTSLLSLVHMEFLRTELKIWKDDLTLGKSLNMETKTQHNSLWTNPLEFHWCSASQILSFFLLPGWKAAVWPGNKIHSVSHPIRGESAVHWNLLWNLCVPQDHPACVYHCWNNRSPGEVPTGKKAGQPDLEPTRSAGQADGSSDHLPHCGCCVFPPVCVSLFYSCYRFLHWTHLLLFLQDPVCSDPLHPCELFCQFWNLFLVFGCI